MASSVTFWNGHRIEWEGLTVARVGSYRTSTARPGGVVLVLHWSRTFAAAEERDRFIDRLRRAYAAGFAAHMQRRAIRRGFGFVGRCLLCGFMRQAV